MDELISRIVSTTGVDAETARKAVEIILGFLKDAGPPERVGELLGAMPGGEAAAQAGSGKAGMMGAMGAFSALSGIGLGMGDIQGVTREVVSYGREKAGEDTVNDVVSSIPGLSQFV